MPFSRLMRRGARRARIRVKRQCCAKKIQLCWKTWKIRNIGYPIGINKIFKTLLEIKIRNHENEDLVFYMNNHSSRVNDMIVGCGGHGHIIRFGVCCDYHTLFYEACAAKNYDCIPILVQNGMGPDAFTRDYREEWESFNSNPMKMAFDSPDVKMIEVLTQEGFDTGNGCPGCSECGYSQTCLFITLFKKDIGDEDMLKIVQVSNWDHVISTYERLVTDWMGKEMLDTSIANRIQKIICKTIPIIQMSVDITVRNVDHVMEMVTSNIVDLDRMLRNTLENFLRLSLWNDEKNGLSVEVVLKCIKDMIDFGADTNIPFTLEYTNVYSDLPTKKNGRGREWTYGSFEDIISSVIDGKEETMKMLGEDFMYFEEKKIEVIDEIFNALDDIYLYIKYKKRVGYLQKRVRGFEDEDDELVKKFVEMDTELFCNVMKYVI